MKKGMEIPRVQQVREQEGCHSPADGSIFAKPSAGTFVRPLPGVDLH
ncbi:hypothetical protein [Streptacidiphilus pinicola]|nr:hypothetical protein [Streptacidiphilus pinicola]